MRAKNFFCLIFLSLLTHHTYALKPSKKYEVIPDTLKLPFEKNTITTSDNVHLKSWTLLPTKEIDRHTTLVIANADAGNMSWNISYAAILSQFGYTVVLFDYRGFGESDAFAIDTAMLYYNEFANDLTAAVNFARKKYAKNKTGIWAFSMGSIITTKVAATTHPDFIIGEGFIASVKKSMDYLASINKKVKQPAGNDNYEQLVAGIKIPMLLFSGSQDKVAPDASVRQLKKNNPKLKIKTFNGGHLQGFRVLSGQFMGADYAAEIDSFFRVE